VLRKKFGCKRDEVAGGWRRLVLGTRYNCRCQIKDYEMGGVWSMHGRAKKCIQLLHTYLLTYLLTYYSMVQDLI
jgi:hypothetical protein